MQGQPEKAKSQETLKRYTPMNLTHTRPGVSPASQSKPRTFHNPKFLSAFLSGAALAVPLLCATFTAEATTKFYPDVVMIQFYDNIPGTAISALTGSPKFSRFTGPRDVRTRPGDSGRRQ
jgi:hypothetical protein